MTISLLILCWKGCCELEMVALCPHEDQNKSCCLHPSPPTWDPAEDLHCITTTFRYLETSGTPAVLIFISCNSLFLVHILVVNSYLSPYCAICTAVLIKCKNCLSGHRLVLGFHLCEWSTGSSPEKIWRHISLAGQQSSQTHLDPVGQDLLRTDQCTDRVQQRLLLAGFHFSWAASNADIPRCSQPRTALRELGPHSAGTGI